MARKKTGRPWRDRNDDGLARAIAALGSVSALAEGLRLSTQAVSQWKRVPSDRCLEIERLAGVSVHDLRPDIFGPKPTKRVRPNKRGEARQAA